MQITNLNKALFYFDLVCLRDRGETYTKTPFVALPYGPVVQNYKAELLEKLVADGRVRSVEEDGGWYVSKRLELADDEHHTFGDDYLDRKAGEVAKALGTDRATEVSRLSHENLAWKVAIKAGSGTPMDMRLALHQVLDDDEWMSRDPDPTHRAQYDDLDDGPMRELLG